MDCGETRVKRAAAAVPIVFLAESYVRTLSEVVVEAGRWNESFLLYGEGVWWQKVASSYTFLDGDGDADFNQHGP